MSMKVDTFANRLRTIMQQTNMNAARLSKRSGVSTSTISQYLSGKYSAKQERVSLFASLFDCNPLWLDGHDVSQYNTESEGCVLPVLTNAVRHGRELAEQSPSVWALASSDYADGKHYYLRVENDSLRPVFFSGDILLIELCGKLEKGQLGVFLINESCFVIRELLDDSVGYYLGLSAAAVCSSTLYPFREEERVRIVGRVLYAVRKW